MTVSDTQHSVRSQHFLNPSVNPSFPQIEEPPYLSGSESDSVHFLESHRHLNGHVEKNHHNEIKKTLKMERLDLSSDEDDESPDRQTPLYTKLLHRLETSDAVLKEIKDGRRIGFYLIKKSIAQGNFSKVKLAIHSLTKECVALKLIDLSQMEVKTQRLLAREAANMARIEHPHVIRFYDSQSYDKESKRYITMEYAPGGELYTKINKTGRYHERDARVFYAQIVSAVDYLHSSNIIHRDIKAENIYFTSPRTVKLGDFGFSIHVSKATECLNTYCGSPPYAAPELFTDEVYCGPPVDVWAMGIILYLMVVGIMPFRADTVKKLRELIKSVNYSVPDILSKDCKMLIKGVLTKSPSERFSLNDIKTSAWMDEADIPRPYSPLPSSSKQGGKFGSTLSPHRIPNQSLPRRNSYCSPQSGQSYQRIICSEDFAVVSRRMLKLGIESQDIDCAASNSQTSSPHILATFRILKHKVQKRRLGEGSSTNLHNSFGGSMGSLPTARLLAEDDQLLMTRRDNEAVKSSPSGNHGDNGTSHHKTNTTYHYPSKGARHKSETDIRHSSKLCVIL